MAFAAEHVCYCHCSSKLLLNSFAALYDSALEVPRADFDVITFINIPGPLWKKNPFKAKAEKLAAAKKRVRITH